MLRLRLLTFDLINTLVKVRVSPAHQYTEVARNVGVHVKETDILHVYQPTWRQMVCTTKYAVIFMCVCDT